MAQTFDRLGTLVVGGAILAPLFQHRQPAWRETIVWLLAAVGMHAIAHFMHYMTQPEEDWHAVDPVRPKLGRSGRMSWSRSARRRLCGLRQMAA